MEYVQNRSVQNQTRLIHLYSTVRWDGPTGLVLGVFFRINSNALLRDGTFKPHVLFMFPFQLPTDQRSRCIRHLLPSGRRLPVGGGDASGVTRYNVVAVTAITAYGYQTTDRTDGRTERTGTAVTAAAMDVMDSDARTVLQSVTKVAGPSAVVSWPGVPLTDNVTNASVFDENNLPYELRFNEGHMVTIITYSILMVISAVGNITVLTIILKRRRKAGTRIHAMLMHLAIADLLVRKPIPPRAPLSRTSRPKSDGLCYACDVHFDALRFG